MNRELTLLEKIILANGMRGRDWLIVSIFGMISAIISFTFFSFKGMNYYVLYELAFFLLVFAHLRFWGYRQNVSDLTVNLKKNLIIYVVIIAVTVLWTYIERDFVLFALLIGWGGYIYFNLAALLVEDSRGKRDIAYALVRSLIMSGSLSVIWGIGLLIFDHIHRL